MIVKKITKKSDNSSSFKRLVNYLVDDKGKVNRVGCVEISNCISDDLDWAVLEVEAVQKINQRSISDKTCHLVMSFPRGEIVSSEIMNKLENEVCDALGYSEHQRVSVTHHDTANLHRHIVINKIHPKNFLCVNYFNDYKILANTCVALEKKYGLQVDNHKISDDNKLSNSLRDMEAMTGVKSFESYLRNLVPSLLTSANSWEDFHHALEGIGVGICRRGNGLVFFNHEKIFVKASALGREYSKNGLERIFGAFRGIDIKLEPLTTFAPSVNYGFELFSEYKLQKARMLEHNLDVYSKCGYDLNILLNSTSLKVKLLSSLDDNHLKHILISYVNLNFKNKISSLSKFYQGNKQVCKSWRSWLMNRALSGDIVALKNLRKSNILAKNSSLVGNKITSRIINDIDFGNIVDKKSIDGSGVIRYKIGNTTILDDGASLCLPKDDDLQSMKILLQLAKIRYSKTLQVSGSSSFEKSIMALAKEQGLKVKLGMSRSRKI